MQVHSTALSLIGDREENQDRVALIERDGSLLAMVLDGMGGHLAGAEAAEMAIESLRASFGSADLPIYNPRKFLREALTSAHNRVVGLGSDVAIGAKPRATCVVVLVQKDKAYWAHIGDSRVYLIRNRNVFERTRDHSHIEILLQEGLITEAEYREHPLRNYVEFCLGGEPGTPTMSIAGAKQLERGDIILLCSDGLWSGAEDSMIGECFPTGVAEPDLTASLHKLMEHAVDACAPSADNTTAAVILWLDKGH